MRRAGATALAVACALAAGCGGSDSTRGTSRTTTAPEPTPAQLLALARALEGNREHGGARFAASLDINGQHALARGRVDFRSGRGTALLSAADASQSKPRRYFWTRQAVLAQAAPGGRRYTREAPDPQNDPVHGMIGFVNLLASETIDNTVTLSDQGARFVRHTTIGGERVDEYRFGKSGSTTLWLARDGGLLRRVRTNRVAGGLTIDLLSHEPERISLPRG